MAKATVNKPVAPDKPVAAPEPPKPPKPVKPDAFRSKTEKRLANLEKKMFGSDYVFHDPDEETEE